MSETLDLVSQIIFQIDGKSEVETEISFQSFFSTMIVGSATFVQTLSLISKVDIEEI